MSNPRNSEIDQYVNNLRRELDGKALYKSLAESEKNEKLAQIYQKISETEGRHADIWRKKLAALGVTPSEYGPSWRTRTLVWLSKRFGVNFVLPSVRSLEEADRKSYTDQSGKTKDALKIAHDEKSHARLLSQISGGDGGVEGSVLARFEGRHRSAGGNALRAAVLGANDGLVSNLCLVLGVAGATSSGSAILISGVAGLIAGASSMALGEWLSVKSSRELYEYEIKTEKTELEASPEEEAEELTLIYEAKGLDEASSKNLAKEIISNSEKALDTLSREELGINPKTLGGSASEAAITSFLLFACGAIIPLVPFLVLQGLSAALFSLIASGIALFAIGAGITLFTGKTVLYSGGRQVLFGLAAAALTFGVGHLFGTILGI